MNIYHYTDLNGLKGTVFTHALKAALLAILCWAQR